MHQATLNNSDNDSENRILDIFIDHFPQIAHFGQMVLVLSPDCSSSIPEWQLQIFGLVFSAVLLIVTVSSSSWRKDTLV